MLKRYVLGFLFTPAEQDVVLIRKNRPSWQAGRLNGVGGHMEEGETATEAMRREFVEEAGLDVDDWTKFAVLRGDGFVVFMFRATHGGIVSTKTDEVVDFFDPCDLPPDVLPNLRWLVPMAMLRQQHDWPFTITERGDF